MALTKVGKEGITGISNSSNANAITITSDENVGIGTDAAVNNANRKTLALQGAHGGQVDIMVGSVVHSQYGTDNFSTGLSARIQSRDGIVFKTGGATETMRINTNGGLITTPAAGGHAIFNEGSIDADFRVETNGQASILFADGANNNLHIQSAATPSATVSGFMFSSDQLYTSAGATAGSNTQVRFINTNGLVGNITTANSGTAFNTSSDYRLKENVSYTWDATTRLKQLKPARFNFISDSSNTLLDGFLAHEVSNTVPNAVTGTKDATIQENGDGYQHIDHSKLVPLLVKTIQELEARLTAGGL